MHYYKRNLGDYAKKAGRLSMLQHGAYTLLIDSCYDREQFPTFEEAIDWTWATSSEEVQAVEFVLAKFFSLIDGVYIQARIKEELDEYKAKADTNKRIALEREEKRKAKEASRAAESTNRARTVNEPLPKEHEPPPNQEPITNNHKPIVKSRATPFAPPSVNEVADYALNNGYPLDAERFVDHYESKGWVVGKSKMKSWQAAARNWSNRDRETKNPHGKTRGTSIADDLNDMSWAN